MSQDSTERKGGLPAVIPESALSYSVYFYSFSCPVTFSWMSDSGRNILWCMVIGCLPYIDSSMHTLDMCLSKSKQAVMKEEIM